MMAKDSMMMDKPMGSAPTAKGGGAALKAALVLLVLAVLGLGGLSYYLYTQVSELRKNPQQVAQQEVQSLIAQVGKLVVLPEGETPTVATVADPEKLKDQAFFAKAKKGDKVLIFTNAKKAILYDPVNNKIVEIAPVNIGNGSTTTTPPTTTTPRPTTPTPTPTPTPTTTP